MSRIQGKRIRMTAPGIVCVLLALASPVDATQYASAKPDNAVRIDAASDCMLSKDFVEENRDRIEALLAAIDLDTPGLEACARASKAGDTKRAAEELLRYYEQRHAAPPVTPLCGENDGQSDYDTILRATDALQGIFTLQNVRAVEPLRPDGGLEWDSDGPNGDKEWAWFMNRHMFIRDLAEAYLYTGRDVYLKAVSGYLEDWIRANPYPGRLTFSPQWRALEAARRITDTWAPVFSDKRIILSPQARILMLCSLPDHAHDLSEYGSFWGGNHRLTELSALALIAVTWPELKDSRLWLDKACIKTRAEIMDQTYPDGAYKELSNHYQHIVQDSLEKTRSFLRYAGISDTTLEKRATLMWDYYASIMRPDGNGPLNNEGDLDYNRRDILDVYASYARQDWLYIASNGERGTEPPRPPSRYFPYAGQAVMRSGWDGDAQWAFFDIGPHGTAHQHNDRMNLELSLGVHDILMDSGRYTYLPGPWKEFFSSARAHNVVLVNGAGQVPPPFSVKKPLPVTAIITDAYDFFAATGSYAGSAIAGTGGARHTRSIFYKRGSYWLVIDNIIAFGPSKIETLWHFHPDVGVTPDGDDFVAWASATTALRFRQVSGPVMRWTFERGSVSPIQGWCSPDYNTKWAATTGIATAVVEKPTAFVWLLYPDGTKEPPPVSVAQEGRRMTIRVGRDGRADTLVIDPAGEASPVIEIAP
jgi:hypothetical protein